MRGTVDDLGMPYPLHTLMPSVFQEDEFTVRWTSGLDDVLAPIVSTLDCLSAYLDPATAPTDFLDWVAGWFGVAVDENLPLARRRAAVTGAVDLYRMRGTPDGLRARLELASGARVEVTDSGGVAWSQTPDTEPPGDDVPWLLVRVFPDPADTVAERTLDELIAADKPAHVGHQLEVIR
jgi:phage tail-like protein